jgi:hypothetical protein
VPPFWKRYGRDSGCCKRSHFPHATLFQHAGTSLERRACRAHVVHDDNAQAVEWSSSPRENECLTNVGGPVIGRQSSLRPRAALAFEDTPYRKAETGRELVSLVEAAAPSPAPVQWNWNDEVCAAEERTSMPEKQGAQWSGNGSPAVVLERVHDRAQRALVVANRPARGDVRPADPAQLTAVSLIDGPPREQRIRADPADRRPQRPNSVPATIADRGSEWIFEWPRARGARRSQDHGHQPVDRFANHTARIAERLPAAGLQETRRNLGEPLNSGREYEVSAFVPGLERSKERDDRHYAVSPVAGASLTSIRSASPHSRSSE